MNARDFFKEEDPGSNDEYSKDTRNWLYDKNDMVMFAERYHQAKLKLLGIANVVGRSEQLVCDCGNPNLTWYGDDDDKTYFCFECKREVTK